MSSARKRRESSDDGGGEGANWMDTYGDLVTLLLCFFVLLFAMSTIDVVKWQAIVGAFTGSNPINTPAFSTIEMAMQLPVETMPSTQDEDEDDGSGAEPDPSAERDLEMLNQLFANISAYVEQHGLQVELAIEHETLSIVIRFAENVLFDSASATLRREAYATMDHIVEALSGNMELIHMVRIEGHTDNVPINTQMFPDNWVLSLYRATNVLRYIEQTGVIEQTRLSCVGYGEFRPIDTNQTVEGRAKNRRVDFVVESNSKLREAIRAGMVVFE